MLFHTLTRIPTVEPMSESISVNDRIPTMDTMGSSLYTTEENEQWTKWYQTVRRGVSLLKAV